MEPQYLPMGFQSTLVLGERLSTPSSSPFGPFRYHSEVAITINGPEAVAVTVVDLPPGQLRSHSAYYTTGRIIAQRFGPGTNLYPDRHTLMGSPGTMTNPPESMADTLIYGIGRVDECYYSHGRKRWIVKVLTLLTVSFHVEYTIPQIRMERFGADMFDVGHVLTLNGDIYGHRPATEEWIVNLFEAEFAQV